MADLALHMTSEQLQHIEAMALQRGYDAPDDYLLALVEADEKIGCWLICVRAFMKP